MISDYAHTTEEVDLGLPNITSDLDISQLFPGDRLLRLHPNWFVTEFKQQGSSFTVAIKDYVTDDTFSLSGSFVFDTKSEELLTITLGAPLETKIRFFNRKTSLRVQIDTVAGEPSPDDPVLLWIRAIREYIRIYLKKTPITLFFRLLMNKMVLTMNPSQRKICLMMAKITAVELAVIVLLVIGYALFVVKNLG